jgi:hypothetical protein
MKKNLPIPQWNPIVFLVLIALLFSACSRKMNFGISQVDPGADGYVKLSSDKNNNTAIHVRIRHLAPVERLTPPGKVYVVWMVTENNRDRNIGQLRNMNLLFSRARVAELKTVTPFKPSKFFITAEDNASVTTPGTGVVLKTL